jgi:hypothetical protein
LDINSSKDNLNLTRTGNKNNLYTKEESISNKRKLIMSEILELLNITNSYDSRKKEIQDYINQKKPYKTLNLTVASTTLNFKKTEYMINPSGMQEAEGRTTHQDGIVLFGYEPFIESKEETEDEIQPTSVFDFSFPVEHENSINLNEFPSFAIYFNTKDEEYYIKDFNIGIGALMKIKEYKFDNNILINIGINYLVICVEDDNLIVKIFNSNILEKSEDEKKFDSKIFKISKNKDLEITIGRNKKCDVSIEDMMISKIQSTIKYKSKEGEFYLYDGNKEKESMNGTWVYILNPILITDNFIFKAEHTLFVVNLIQNK